MKIQMKLNVGFSIVVFLLMVVAVLSYFTLHDVENELINISDDKLPKIIWSNQVIDQINIEAESLRNSLLTDEKAESENQINIVYKTTEKAGPLLDSLDKYITLPEGRKILSEINSYRPDYLKLKTQIIDYIKSGNKDTAKILLMNDFKLVQNHYYAGLEKLIVFQSNLITDDSQKAVEKVESFKTLVVIVAAVGLLIAVLISVFISRSITKPLSTAVNAADNIAGGNTSIKIESNSKDETGILLSSMKIMADNINNLTEELNKISEAAVNGKLDVRGNVEDFEGDYKKIIEGFNNTLDAVISPLNITAEYVDRISKGDMPPKITDNYKGDFNEIKNNLNQCIEAVNNLIEDTQTLNLKANEGNLYYRADKNRHSGDFRKIIEGTNLTLNTFTNMINHIPGMLYRCENDKDYSMIFVSSGAKELTGYTHETILNQKNGVSYGSLVHPDDSEELNRIIDKAVAAHKDFKHVYRIIDSNKRTRWVWEQGRGLYDENNKLVKLEGYVMDISEQKELELKIQKVLDYQSNETEKLVEGLNVLAAGDFTVHVELGEPDEDTKNAYMILFDIKGAINKFLDSVLALRNDAEMLAESARLGKLDIRADESKHHGDFRLVIKGFNDALDNVIGPLNVAAEYVDRISKGDIPPHITDNYFGDFNEIKNNLNQCIEAVGMMVEDSLMLVNLAEQGELKTRADVHHHHGDFRKIIEGVNRTLDLVVAPIEETGNTMSVFATGDLTSRITSEYMGDFARLKDDINTFADTLSELIIRLTDSIENTASAAHEISSTAESLAAASQEQSAQADEVANAVEAMSKTITENAMSAGRTAEVATKNSTMASESGKVVELTVNKMMDIAAVVKNSASSIEQLGESSKQIGEIISVIDDIADQTNLLALNAAIEAARAGEQGRGFAVVADEVRKLAERTTEATKQIAKMIKGIQQETEQAVSAMNKGTSEVQSGIELADKAGDSLKQILNSTHEVLDMVNQIAAASEEQSATSEQISKNVMAISKVTSDAATRVEDVAKTSDELARMTEQLRDMIATFKVDNSGRAFVSNSGRALSGRSSKQLPSATR
ncbi:MAG: methyl-accepting chemotaxis protein [Candidatus Kapabacteria bacterium]|jgi:methyl-accepting chemotaxis protein|nr:methyl-accepting chemotaxis protein [Candidatus Kapabacteria bacterium]